jgi:hypothetical protein
MILNLSGVRPTQRNDPGHSAPRCKNQDMQSAIDLTECAESHFAVVLSVVCGNDRRIEFETSDKCEVDTVLAQIDRAFALIPDEAI